MLKYDYLIVGQGTAGTVLAQTLLKNNKTVLVVDDNQTITSSKVAAGLFNPITGRKLVKTWLCDEIFAELHSFYPNLEKALKTSFFNPLNIYIPFDSLEKQNSWFASSGDKIFDGYIENISANDQFTEDVKGGFGGMEIKQSGFVNVRLMLKKFRDFLIQKGNFREEKLNPKDLQTDNPNFVIWKDIEAQKVIFCEGVIAKENHFFKGLDFRETKGEILEIQMESKIDKFVNRGCWLLPLGNGIYKVGSTYERQDLTNNITENGRKEIVEKLEGFLKTPYKIIGQEAAVRPTTHDRRPYIGLHQQHSTIGIFNGFGTKGTSLAPYLATHFYQHLEEGKPLRKDCNFLRCKSYGMKKQL